MNNFCKLSLTFFFVLIIKGLVFSQIEKASDLNFLFIQLSNSKDDSIKIKINKQIVNEINNKIEEYEHFEELKNIKGLFALLSKDKRVKILTWSIRLSDKTVRYFGVINYYLKETGRYYTEILNQTPQPLNDFENTLYSSENWYGAVYYDIINQRYYGKDYYLLLGYNDNNDFTNLKIIDVLEINAGDYVKFGSQVFNYNNSKPLRLVFEYAERISMNLKYDKDSKLVIWDHLSPSKPELEGHFEYYGPDMTYDALKFEKGIWQYLPDVILDR